MDVTILLAVVLVVVLVIGVRWVLRRPDRRAQAPDPASTSGRPAGSPPPPSPGHLSPQVPVFKVVALGLSGSGKTVLLASMFHQLDHVSGGRTFYLEAAPEQRVALSGVYRTVSDPQREWPRATRISECTEYVFHCIALDDDGARHHILDLSYLDYAGELLEYAQDAGRDSLAALARHVGGAQALLGLLDGQRILQLLRGEPEGDVYLQYEVRSMFGFLQAARAPIHLVITKWDLVRGFGEAPDADDRQRLDRVIGALMAYDHFRALVYSGPTQLVRLIPVSAVGRGFADLRADGAVVKRPDGRVRPMNVEVPVCAVVPDLFRQIERTLDEAALREMDETLRRSLTFRATDVLSGVAAFFGRPFGGALRAVLVGAMGAEVANEVGRMFVEWAARPYERLAQNAGAARALAEEEFGRFTAARERVLGQFDIAVRRLEATMPNSELGRR